MSVPKAMNFTPVPVFVVGILWSIYSIIVGVSSWQYASAIIPVEEIRVIKLLSPYLLPALFLVPFVFPRKVVLAVVLAVGAISFAYLFRFEKAIGGTIWGKGTIAVSLLLVGYSLVRIWKADAPTL